MTKTILIDAGPLVAILHQSDRDHSLCVDTLKSLRTPLSTTWMPVPEVAMDIDTERTIRLFLTRVRERYDVADTLLFSSRARHEANPESDTDIAVLLRGEPGKHLNAALDMAAIAFDVMLESGVLVDAISLWEDEWTHPERFSNPALIKNIQQDGIRL